MTVKPHWLPVQKYLQTHHKFTATQNIIQNYQHYLTLLQQHNKFYNLTTITDDTEAAVKHFLDALTVLKVIGSVDGPKLKVIDVGTGPGFPGLPLSIAMPERLEMTLLDASIKRTAFLRTVLESLPEDGQLVRTSTNVLTGRVEQFVQSSSNHPLRYQFDHVVCRGFSSMRTSIEALSPLLKKGGSLIFMKRLSHPNPTETKKLLSESASSTLPSQKIFNESKLAQEMSLALPSAIKLNADILFKPIMMNDIDAFRDDDRCLVVVKQLELAPKKYPRLNSLPWYQPL